MPHQEIIRNAPDRRVRPTWFFRVSLEEQMLFAKRLGILLKAGVPILLALQIIRKQALNSSVRRLFADLAQGVEQGQALHSCLEIYRRHFGEFAVNIVRIGEISGTLHESLDYLAEEIKKKKELRRKVANALVYPGFIGVATVGIALLLITYVFPKILPLLMTLQGRLPFTTRTLILAHKLLTARGWLIMLIILGLIAGWFWLLRQSRRFRFWADASFLRTPLLGKLFVYYHLANFSRTLAVLLKSGVKIVEASKITASTATNLAYREALNKMSEAVAGGGKASDFLESRPGLFPPLVSQMVLVGESTGQLSGSLMYLAEIYEQETEALTKSLASAIEPFLMVFMGFLVGFIAMSIITPIYTLTQSLTR